MAMFDNARPRAARAMRVATPLIPLAFGLFAVLLGQDHNWDLRNYHLYNAFAFLNHKIGLDLAPGQWQSYFNPTIDLPYYLLTKYMPAPLAGMVMGTLHGCNFLLVLAIARQLLPAAAPRVPFWLAIAGVLGSGFLSEVGNTMGDNLTSLFVLGAVLLVVTGHARLLAGQATAAWLPGLVMGLGVGLKLTNGIYALALCLALLTIDGAWRRRFGLATLFGIGVLAGIAVSAGHWFWLMWHTFHNPLFPQFNNWFGSPMALPMGIGDTGWLAATWYDKLAWPFVFAVVPRRVSELSLTLAIWPVLYVAMVCHALRRLYRPVVSQVVSQVAPAAGATRLVLVFFAIGYVGWLNLFGIYRYLIALELLAPLALWLVLQPMLRRPSGSRVVAGLLIAMCVLTLARLPKANWGHIGWRMHSFAIATPTLPDPAATVILTIQADPPMGWLATAFAPQTAFVSIGSAFPESAGYRAQLRRLLERRRHVLLMLDESFFTDNKTTIAPGTALHAERTQRAERILADYGLRRQPAPCPSFAAFAGDRPYPYRLCDVDVK